MPLSLRRALAPSRLGLVLGVALLFSVAPLLHFDWLPTAVTDTVLPHFTAAGAEMLPTTVAGTSTVTGDRQVTTATGVDPFTAIGLQLGATPTEAIYARAHTVGGDWGPWSDFDVATENHDGVQKAVIEQPLYVKNADGYEVNVPSAIASSTKVVLIRDTLRRVMSTASPLAGAETPPFGIHYRSEWGARPYNGTPEYGDSVKYAVIHHSVQPNDYTPADVPGMIRADQAFHMDTNGWADLGYNFVVDKFGGIWEGRQGGVDRPVIGAHAAGFNTDSTGIMVIGDYTQAQPSAAALESVAQVAGWKLFLSGNNPSSSVTVTSGGSPRYPAGQVVTIPRVVGHQDVGLTACPGSIENYLGQIRARAQQWTNWDAATSRPFGFIDSMAQGPSGSVTFSGWAIDPSASGAPSQVRVDAPGVSTTLTADQSRPDVGAAYPNYGSDHGYSGSLTMAGPGYQHVCVTALRNDGGPSTLIGCRYVYIDDPTGSGPVGSFTLLRGIPGGFTVSGTVHDPSSPSSPLSMYIEVNGARIANLTSAAKTGAFWVQPAGLVAGTADVCAVAMNIGSGPNMRFACSTVAIQSAPPVGGWDWVGGNPQGDIGFTGWAYDPETLGPIQVEVAIDGRRWRFTANQYRSSLASMLGGYGGNHGWGATVHVGTGVHHVCIGPVDVPTGQVGSFGCRQVVIK
jgi:hypothetical protein